MGKLRNELFPPGCSRVLSGPASVRDRCFEERRHRNKYRRELLKRQRVRHLSSRRVPLDSAAGWHACKHTEHRPCTVLHEGDSSNQRCAANLMQTMHRWGTHGYSRVLRGTLRVLGYWMALYAVLVRSLALCAGDASTASGSTSRVLRMSSSSTHLGEGGALGPRIGRGSGKALEAEVVAAGLAEPALAGSAAVAFDRAAPTGVAGVANLVAMPAERAEGEAMALPTFRSLRRAPPLQGASTRSYYGRCRAACG